MAVFLFPGQGSQYTGMGVDLYESDKNNEAGIKSLFKKASEIWNFDVLDLLNSSPEILKRADKGQLAIVLVSLAVLKNFAKQRRFPTACAGFSLGEYPALFAAGVLSEDDTLFLVKERGRIMQKVCDEIQGDSNFNSDAPGMSAILGLSSEKIDIVLSQLGKVDVWATNYNSPMQTVISGTALALSLAEEKLKEAGARRVVRLKVTGPFHSPLMKKAGDSFGEILKEINFNNPKIPIFSNVTGKQVKTSDEAKQNAIAHIEAPVLWTKTEKEIEKFIKNNSKNEDFDLIECGPGKVLTGLWKDSKNIGVCLPYSDVLLKS